MVREPQEEEEERGPQQHGRGLAEFSMDGRAWTSWTRTYAEEKRESRPREETLRQWIGDDQRHQEQPRRTKDGREGRDRKRLWGKGTQRDSTTLDEGNSPSIGRDFRLSFPPRDLFFLVVFFRPCWPGDELVIGCLGRLRPILRGVGGVKIYGYGELDEGGRFSSTYKWEGQ